MSVRCLATLPVVTLGGDAIAHVKDAVFDPAAERITSFTLTGRSLWSGQLPRDLPWPAVYRLGRHAVMVRDRDALFDLPLSVARRDALRGRLLGAQVATDAGEPVGTVLDVLVRGGTSGQVVAFRLAAHRGLAPGSRHHRHRVYVPRGETRSADGRTLIIPEHATTYVSDDLPDFVTRVGAFHQRRRSALP